MNIPPGLFDSNCKIVITKNGQQRHVALSELLAVLFAANNTFSGTNTFNAAVMVNALLTTNGQVAFPATQNPSADANTLDDYEEGTFTPALSFGGGSTGLTYGSRAGQYTKIGNMVWFDIQITLTARGSSTGDAEISGLPFTSAATGTGVVMFGSYTAFQSLTSMPFGRVPPSGTSISLRTSGGATSHALMQHTNLNTTSSFTLSGYYRV